MRRSSPKAAVARFDRVGVARLWLGVERFRFSAAITCVIDTVSTEAYARPSSSTSVSISSAKREATLFAWA